MVIFLQKFKYTKTSKVYEGFMFCFFFSSVLTDNFRVKISTKSFSKYIGNFTSPCNPNFLIRPLINQHKKKIISHLSEVFKRSDEDLSL